MISTVLNVNSIGSLGPLLNYCSAFGREDEKGGEVVMANILTDYAASKLDYAYREFQESINPHCKHKMKHLILAHHPQDSARILADPKLEREILKNFIEEVKKQGIDLIRFKFVIYRHRDQAHLHYHMAICNTDETGHQMKDYCIGLKVVKAANTVSERFGLHSAVPENVQRQESENIRKTQTDEDGSLDFEVHKRHYHVTQDWKVTQYPKKGNPITYDLSGLKSELIARGAHERELREIDWYRIMLAQKVMYTCQDLVFCMTPGNDLPNIKMSTFVFGLMDIGIKLMVMIGKEALIKEDLKAMHKRTDRIPVVDLQDLANLRDQQEQYSSYPSISEVGCLDANSNTEYESSMNSLLERMNRIRQEAQHANAKHGTNQTSKSSRDKNPSSSSSGETRRQRAVRMAHERKEAEQRASMLQKFKDVFVPFCKETERNVGIQIPSPHRVATWLANTSENHFGQPLHLYGIHVQDASNKTLFDLPDDYVQEAKDHWGEEAFKFIGHRDREAGTAHRLEHNDEHELD